MSTTKRQIKLGISMTGLGYHYAAWRLPEAPDGGNMDIRHSINLVQTAERGLFDIAFLGDGVGIRGYDEPKGSAARTCKNVLFEPFTLHSALAMVTKHIGLVATASTTYNEPYTLARKLASLDHISGGRAAWNVVTSFTDIESQNFGQDNPPEYETRYERAHEFVQVVKGLWDSWDDDAFVRDKASGINYDDTKLHVLNHRGKYFKVRGPLNVDRPIQGHAVIVQAGASEQGQEMAAETADVVFCATRTIEDARAFYASLKGRLAKYGREPEDLLVLPGFSVVTGRTREEAHEKYERGQELIHPLVGMSTLAMSIGDLSAYDVDGPVPDVPNPRMRSRARLMIDLAHKNNYTIRQLYEVVAGGNGHHPIIGSYKDVADEMEAWFTSGAADGFNIIPPFLPQSLDDVVDLVVPELQRRGIYRTAYEGTTFRDILGLKRPVDLSTRRALQGQIAHG
jgi:alkanesulfonate monooxygenase